jgi:ABC-type multidrug transport system fused ATPase/permease subunit
LNEILGTKQEEMVRAGGKEVTQFEDMIRFEHVSLQYPGREEHALCDISLVLEKGKSLALVGPSGSGKSSIADLLLGLYEPTAGRITVDGVNIRDMDIGSWRGQLGTVSQDTLLFNATVRDNMLFAKPDATDPEILEALKAADAEDFIQKLPQRLETLVGERGFILSGGQRQRLAIARALLRKPAILILDEATSALDTNAEQAVQVTLDSLMTSGTRLIIAHRLSTIKNADQIVVLNHGRIVESGSHSELLSQDGLYASLWHKQSGGSEVARPNPVRLISPVR